MARATLSISEVAKAMGTDRQTIRLMIQNKIVPWGECWIRPGSTRYSYIISPKVFFESTGIALREELRRD